MNANISVGPISSSEFRVTISENATRSSHRVTLQREDYDRLTAGKVAPEELVRMSFEFLLEREPKESILSRFDLMVIARYFPAFEREMNRRLSQS
jgi:hypothetical protein